VLINGETDAEVVVHLGSGDDVAVVDTSSDVTVVAGRGDDALLGNGENTTFKGGAGVDIAIGASEGSSDRDRSTFGPGIECDLLPGTQEMRDKCRAKYAEK
jgi:Ca2+-binding RTX toxin-like protein